MNLLSNNVWKVEPQAFNRYVQLLARLSAVDMVKPEAFVTAADEGVDVVNGIARIPVRGPMVKSLGFIEEILGFTSTQSIQRDVEQAAADPDVQVVVLEIDSPGGSVSGLADLSDAVFQARQSKRVVAQVDGMAASAAYQVASQANEIYLGREDIVGSIGVKLMLYDFSEMFEKEGIEAVPIDTGEFKSAGALGTEITEVQRADFQRIVDFYFEGFVDAIIRGRAMSDESVRNVADGRVFIGEEAVDLGLADGVQTLRETLSSLSSENRRGPARRANARIGCTAADF